MKKICFAVATLLAASSALAAPITSFVNADFDSGIVTTPGPFKGFDAPAAPEIVGWTNYGSPSDAGVEASGAWWILGYAYDNAAFVNAGGGAYNTSSYVIQPGDQFTVSVVADAWGTGAITASLFYDNPTNVIGTYTFTPNAWHFDVWTDPSGIAATPASVGGTLGVLIMNTGGANIVGFDEITVDVQSVPEPAAVGMLSLGGAALLLTRRRTAC